MHKKRLIKIGLAVLFLAGFFYGSYQYWSYRFDYSVGENAYDDAVKTYVMQEPDGPDGTVPQEPVQDGPPAQMAEPAPIQVDFGALLKKCPDAQGWIYCEGTVINYPVVQGADNDLYLHHTYTGEYAASGSIFLEAMNAPGFQDSNTIIYGHHMKDKSMFACLSNWSEQAFYEGHKCMWLLTPEQDYRIDLIAGYVTPADSDTYAIFQGPSSYFDEYLAGLSGKSDFVADDIELNRDAKYVLLSTCDYTFQDARYVLHGKLVPCRERD